MKKFLALLTCLLLIVTLSCPVWAEEETPADPTGTVDTDPTGGDTDPTTEPADPVTDPTTTPTTPAPTTAPTTPAPTTAPTTAKPLTPAKASVSISYSNLTIKVRATGVNGQALAGASVTVTADGQVWNLTTGADGIAQCNPAAQPHRIACQMAAFQSGGYSYSEAAASATLGGATVAPTNPTAPTVAPTTGTTETTLTEITTTVDNSGAISTNVTTADETVTTTAGETAPTTATAAASSSGSGPNWVAIGLIGIGALLLIAAVLVIILVLLRGRNEEDDEDEEEETTEDIESEEEETSEDGADTDTAASSNAPASAFSGNVSLEDLFRDFDRPKR